jgi:hypothetical protein
MGLFSKEHCYFCNKEVGILGRKKLHDCNFICKDCEKNCSAFLEVSRFNADFLQNNMEYMKKQDKLYKEAFETLDKSEKIRIIGEAFYGIVFADSIAMFEVINPMATKKNYKELFRYDYIKNYTIYTIPGGEKKYSEVGVEIALNCKIGLGSSALTDGEKKISHPYCKKLRIVCAKDTNDENEIHANQIVRHLNELYGKTSDTVIGSIKEAFTGTAKQKQEFNTAMSALKGLKGFATSKATDDKQKKAEVQEDMNKAIQDVVDLATDNVSKFTRVADEVEKRVWGIVEK